MKDEKDETFKKGQLLVVKTPPYYKKEYFYEVLSAGGKQVRASLYHSPKVKKSWSIEELKLLIEHGVIRLARDGEQPSQPPAEND
jgi:hypothetical protein